MKKQYSIPTVEVINTQPQTGIMLMGSATGPEPKPAIKHCAKLPVASIPG